jgi:hypothetical protein
MIKNFLVIQLKVFPNIPMNISVSNGSYIYESHLDVDNYKLTVVSRYITFINNYNL